MPPFYYYLLIDLGTIFFPLLLSFDKKVAFYKHWPRLFAGIALVGAAFVAWDATFTYLGIWSFNPNFLLGPSLLGLPMEEWLFFLVVPYSCVFIYACILAYFPREQKFDWGYPFLLWLGFALLVVAILFYDRAYTFWACGLCGWLCLGINLFRKKLPGFRADSFVLSYAIAMLPFFLVNGLLTSLPVVLYNDAENLGLRIGTVPVEDTFYGMLLIMGVAVIVFARSKKV